MSHTILDIIILKKLFVVNLASLFICCLARLKPNTVKSTSQEQVVDKMLGEKFMSWVWWAVTCDHQSALFRLFLLGGSACFRHLEEQVCGQILPDPPTESQSMGILALNQEGKKG